MINNTLYAKRILFVVAVVAVVASVAAVGAQADHHKSKHDRGSWRVLTEMEGKGFLGVQMQELTAEMRDGLNVKTDYGVLISTVIEDSPAAKAGLEEGDIIVRYDGKKVESPEELRELVAETEAGDEVKIKIIRDDAEKTLTVAIGEWPGDYGFSMDNFRLNEFDWEDMPQFVHALMPRRLGVNVSSLNEDLAPYFGVETGEGLLVLSVNEDSMADEMGVKSGDVITEVQGEAIDEAGDIRRVLHDIEEGDTFEVKVVRKKRTVALSGEMRADQTSDRIRNVFRFSDNPRRVYRDVRDSDEEIRKELDDLKAEIEALKKELKKSQRR